MPFRCQRRLPRGLGALLPLLSLALAAQEPPPLPDAPRPLAAPTPAELLPLRPFELDETRGARKPFDWRGNQVSEQGDTWTLEQGAIQGQGLMLLADRIEYDTRTAEIIATGHIRLETPDLRLRCEKLRMNWRSQSGEALMLEMDLPPNWTLKSSRVAFETLRKWAFDAVEVTSCPEEKPGWTAKLSSLQVDLDGFATLHNLRVLLGSLPTHIYLPYGIYPAKLDRSSGLLPPTLGTSGSLGASLGLSYYQTLGPSAEATLSPEYFTKAGTLWGGEARWKPGLTHEGSFSGLFIDQQDIHTDRYRYNLKEVWQAENGWQLAVDANDASDNLVDADYGHGLGSLGQTNFNSSLYLGKAYTWGSLSLSAARERTFFLTTNQGDPFYNPLFPSSLERDTLPQLEARLFPVSLGDFYLDGGLRSSAFAYRIRGSVNTPDATYSWDREDLNTRLYGRLGQLGPFRVDAETMLRGTHYGGTLDQPVFDPNSAQDGQIDPSANPAFDPFRVDGPATTRLLASAHIRFSGPQLGRTFEDFHLFGYEGELKHVVEPFFGFTRTTGFGDAGSVPRFDAIDSRPGTNDSASNEESIELGVKQYFFGRQGPAGPFSSLLRWSVATRFHFEPIVLSDGRVQKGWGSLDSDIDFEPQDSLRISFRRSSDLTGGGGTDQSLSADFKQGQDSSVSLAYFSTGLNQFLVRQKGLKLGGLKRFMDDRLRLEIEANYNFGSTDAPKGFSSSLLALTYVQPCVAYVLRFTHVAVNTGAVSGGREDRLDLTITLRNLGDLFTFRR